MHYETDAEKTVLIDMDGVLANFDHAVLQGLSAHTELVDRQNFYIAKDYPNHKEQVRSIMSHPEFFFELPLIEGALEGWAALLELGYEPRICSAPLMMNPKSQEGKLAWLATHLAPTFGHSVVDMAIIDRHCQVVEIA
ncbi:5' nucleotidase, NT5C type [Rhodococcus sp. UFZ-B548]|uniref:5' nucleotidase, NT5C type n=1 Tax=Rhodococcus sp. UFZ-B548 TaxID=2742212 RepID=UPI0015F3EFD4|nr:hypothetical protein [Rhodococcus sp. UFZ-B548]